MALTSSTFLYPISSALRFSRYPPTAANLHRRFTYSLGSCCCPSSSSFYFFSSSSLSFSPVVSGGQHTGFRKMILRDFRPNTSPLGSLSHLQRGYYEKKPSADTENDASPSSFFSSFGTKNKNAQAVPKELHQSNAQAVSDAETVNRLFLCYFTLGMVALLYYLWYFLYADDEIVGGTFSRPEGYGVCSAPPRRYSTSNAVRLGEIPRG